MSAGRIGRSSIRFDLEIHGKDADDFRASGEVVWVYTNQTTHKTAPVRRELIDLIVAMDGEGVLAG